MIVILLLDANKFKHSHIDSNNEIKATFKKNAEESMSISRYGYW